MATSAAPLIFAPLSKDRDGMVELFVDGGLGYNNPVNLLLLDACNNFPNRKIKALVSLGTGVKQASQVENTLLSLARKVAEMATDATQEAEHFRSFLRSTDIDLYRAYFRFDPSGEISHIPLQEWRMLAAISQRTRAWLSSSPYGDEAARCAELLTPVAIKRRKGWFEMRTLPVLSVLMIAEHQIQVQMRSAESASDQALPDLQVRLVHGHADWTEKTSVVDPVDGSELQISLWRTVRIPEDGKVYDLPAGLGRFPLVDAAQLRNRQLEGSTQHHADV